jgi:hypothetical protein
MQRRMRALTLTLCLVTMLIVSPGLVTSQVREPDLKYCVDLTFSTEEDFVGQDIIISDGDLLGMVVYGATGPQCGICAHNTDLLNVFEVSDDIGLDAADVISADAFLVAFSTELDSPNNALPTIQFTAGDLLATNGTRIPNMALTILFQVPYDIGLDAMHFVGATDAIIEFLTDAAQFGRDDWLDPDPELLVRKLEEFDIDILFSTEGTWSVAGAPGFLDGDLLSVRRGAIVIPNADLLDPSVPAGIPADGVDFGLDAVTADRWGTEETIHYSTEILYDGRLSFTDGDVLRNGNGVRIKNNDLLHCFEPKATELGLDALSNAGNWPPLPGTPTLYPIDNPEGLRIYSILWSSAPNAESYVLEEASDSDLADAHQIYAGSSTSHVVSEQMTGRYYYRVKGCNAWGDSGWSEVRLADVRWEVEPNDEISQANGPLVSSLTYYGIFPGTDDVTDYFSFELTAPHRVQVWLTNIPAGCNYDLVLRKQDASSVAYSFQPGDADEYIDVPTLASGFYYIQVYRTSGAGSSQPYHLRVVYE